MRFLEQFQRRTAVFLLSRSCPDRHLAAWYDRVQAGRGGTALDGWIGFADRFVVESNPTKESVRRRCRMTQMESGNIAEVDNVGTYRMLAFAPGGDHVAHSDLNTMW